MAAEGSPDLDAEVLLRLVLGLSRGALFAHPERPLGPDQRERLRALLERRAAGEPVAYLTGEREFMGLAFAVDRRVLIPRPDTEGLVERALAWIERAPGAAGSGGGAPLRVVDVGTGSGAIAVAVAALAPRGVPLRVVATDLSAGALRVARANAARLLPPGRPGVALVRCSLLAGLRGPLDVVLANLPYIPGGDLAGLPPAVARYEPRLALDGGGDGLDPYRALLRQLPGRLAPASLVLLECDPRQVPALRRLVAAALPGAAVDVVRDLAGRERTVAATLR